MVALVVVVVTPVLDAAFVVVAVLVADVVVASWLPVNRAFINLRL